MFCDSLFTGDLTKWATRSVKFTTFMFNDSVFRGDISKWNVNDVESMYHMFTNSPLAFKEPSWFTPLRESKTNTKHDSSK